MHQKNARSCVAGARSFVVCACSPVAVYESLKVARAAADFDDATLKQMTVKAMERNSQTVDYKEGPRAFLEKRQPQWSGR